MKHILLALVVFGFLIAKSGVANAAVSAVPAGTQVKLAFEVEGTKQLPPDLDILFVVDNSASMSSMQNLMAAAVEKMGSAFEQMKLNVHAAVTTSTLTSLDGGYQCNSASRTAICDGRFNNGFISNRQPNFSSELAQRLLVGADGGGTEAFFDPALLALDSPLKDGENKGFLRADAQLAIVFLTDAEDQGRTTAAEFVAKILAIKGGDASKVHLITSTVFGPTSSTCSRNGESEPFKIGEAAKLLNGVEINICDSNMGEQVGAALLKLDVPSIPTTVQYRSFKIPAAPELATLKVTFGKQTLAAGDFLSGWVYRSNTNRILIGEKFDYATEPTGTKLEIEYITNQWPTNNSNR